jgi:hypothetical protein
MPPEDKWAKPSCEENFEGGEDKYHHPRWCPDGLSRSKKCRVQWLRNLEEAEAQYLEMLRKAHPDLAVKVHCTQEKDYKHLKALYLKGYINGHPVSKMLVDNSAAINIMPYSVLHRLRRFAEDLIKTNITLSDFNGQASEAQGVLNVDLTVGSKTVLTFFFIVSSKSTYTVLLGRDWIHANCYIPSTMHQCLIQWDCDEVEVVHADDLINISLAAMSVRSAEDQEPILGISLEGCDHVEATKNGVRLVLSTGLTE